MTSAFSSNGQNVIERIVVEQLSEPTPENLVPEVYELKRCAKWINVLNLQSVCLQFPNEMLKDSVRVCQELKKRTSCNILILGDTNYGSCCIDFIAAEHVPSDGMIHYGHSCLSNAYDPKIPILFVFPKVLSVDKKSLKEKLKKEINALGTTLLIFDCDCCHIFDSSDLQDLLNISVVGKLLTGENEDFASVFCKGVCGENCFRSEHNPRHQHESLGRGFCFSSEVNLKEVSVIYVGSEGPYLHNLIISWSHKFKCVKCFNNSGQSFEPSLNYSRLLRRQLFLAQHVKEATSVALVVANPADPSILRATRHAKHLLKSRPSPPRIYTLAVGKPNPAKLANFQEIDVFLVFACPNNPLLSPESRQEESKEYYKPIVGLSEVELALNQGRTNASNDYKDLLEGGFDYIRLQKQDSSLEADTSLLTGKVISLKVSSENEKSKALVSREENLKITTLSVGSLLAQRTWQGLDPELGQSSPSLLSEGRSGIACTYQAEPKSEK
ncbi:2-(3-amino-3-carboxypropyl)histidine synthase subunit 2 [Neocloeon triangulifer]|uniref:2-(3-amino-3-carboxypropyl)histidine synthase subunit 2 n=1 Tax=Neocloeon triangulifer TaxID=2078957 RepID=UPI00286EBCD3|nr:2-(3-amino-3-carboxypropyl)histidine synthase subunit 2 [Neocloeon triangulifer]